MHWAEILGKLDDYLAVHTRMIQICGEAKAAPNEESESKSKVIVHSILRFLRNLLKGCNKNKKYFQSFEVKPFIVCMGVLVLVVGYCFKHMAD